PCFLAEDMGGPPMPRKIHMLSGPRQAAFRRDCIRSIQHLAPMDDNRCRIACRRHGLVPRNMGRMPMPRAEIMTLSVRLSDDANRPAPAAGDPRASLRRS